MNSSSLTDAIRREYGGCCLTDSYRDQGCGIDVSGFNPHALVTIHGTQFQRCPKHGSSSRLCDRLIFGRLVRSNRPFVCAAELKGGKNLDASVAIKQIQGGLDLAGRVLSNRSKIDWYPLLFYSGGPQKRELGVLRTRKVRFRGEQRIVDRVDCGSSLIRYLP